MSEIHVVASQFASLVASHSRRHLPHAGTSDYWNNVTKDKAGPPFLTLLLREKLGLRISVYVLSVTSNSVLRLWQLLPVRDPSPDCASYANHCLIIPYTMRYRASLPEVWRKHKTHLQIASGDLVTEPSKLQTLIKSETCLSVKEVREQKFSRIN